MTGLTVRNRIWHKSYCRWYDLDRAGRRVRAALWGWIADRLA